MRVLFSKEIITFFCDPLVKFVGFFFWSFDEVLFLFQFFDEICIFICDYLSKFTFFHDPLMQFIFLSWVFGKFMFLGNPLLTVTFFGILCILFPVLWHNLCFIWELLLMILALFLYLFSTKCIFQWSLVEIHDIFQL